MKKHPDFEGALEYVFNEYQLVHSDTAKEADFRQDFARHVARRLRQMGIGLHHISEPETVVKARDADLAEADDFISSLLDT